MARVGYDVALAALAAGDRVMVTHPDPMKATDKASYALVRGGVSLTATTFRKLADRLEPVREEALFQDEAPAQTYRLAQ